MNDLPVFLLNTIGNKNRKAGALNHAYQLIREHGYTYIVSMDADTLWNSNFLSQNSGHGQKMGENIPHFASKKASLHIHFPTLRSF